LTRLFTLNAAKRRRNSPWQHLGGDDKQTLYRRWQRIAELLGINIG